MKTTILIMALLFSLPLQAACKCNCNPLNMDLCASSYDLDHPCNGTCPSSTPGMTPMRTACPLTQEYNPITGAQIWISHCPE